MKYKADSKHFEQSRGSKVDEIGVGTAQKGVSPLLGEHLSKQVFTQVNSSKKRCSPRLGEQWVNVKPRALLLMLASPLNKTGLRVAFSGRENVRYEAP